ncbi:MULTISPECIES: hypothetical protein [unclassified Mesorhizobium]|uniref:hypothetical protein n=1 Tax=unclassified Mesorhizobium TaxID=325217 RepID=UPI000F7506F8|nr:MULTISPECIES: hypothetical protein [unclassified Mesorhizobium]AZO21810.1 hypothetical protein EJ070_14690 [Mesorhizobium sp. M1E.F.Ca.ET.045.02.1.1]RUW33174.1 hypothetical protein EOA38_13690 [Mesorhizobium sp. M1E.F.Ca.ET.041.01.1.1]RUW77069.1 hypothetical protein EOA29_26870 [Mesorhizobium sp. M1E.F.Ca.ET.063.01.1.1]RWD90320.1 MAG: hypothetical protein EOS38_08545 [Mesorhizobium sp.]RWD95575.1 MAG: hypothetical protein EOS39_01615 [Mesorhizobium sp.]
MEAIYAHHVLHGLATFETMPPQASELEARRETVVLAGTAGRQTDPSPITCARVDAEGPLGNSFWCRSPLSGMPRRTNDQQATAGTPQ